MSTSATISRITPESSSLYFHILHDAKDNCFFLEDWFGNQMFHGRCKFSLNVCKAIQTAASLWDDRELDRYLRPFENQSKIQTLASLLRKKEARSVELRALEAFAIDFFDNELR